jgi:UTP-glucose-1-phosphate uridylyltransferase
MKGVIILAGYGMRFLPASKAVPKEMSPHFPKVNARVLFCASS